MENIFVSDGVLDKAGEFLQRQVAASPIHSLACPCADLQSIMQSITILR